MLEKKLQGIGDDNLEQSKVTTILISNKLASPTVTNSEQIHKHVCEHY